MKHNPADFGSNYGADAPTVTTQIFTSAIDPSLYTATPPTQAPQTFAQKLSAYWAAYPMQISFGVLGLGYVIWLNKEKIKKLLSK